MIKFVLIVCFALINVQAQACSGCAIGKNMAKCDYYVVRKHDLSYQNTCLSYAKSIDIDGMFAKASWYYLLGGDKDSAKKSATKALKIGQNYAAEYRGFVYILENDMKNARKELVFFKNRVGDIEFAKKDIKAMKNIYKNFNDKVAYKILY